MHASHRLTLALEDANRVWTGQEHEGAQRSEVKFGSTNTEHLRPTAQACISSISNYHIRPAIGTKRYLVGQVVSIIAFITLLQL